MKDLQNLINKAVKEFDKKRDKLKDGKGITGYSRKEDVQPVGFDKSDNFDFSKDAQSEEPNRYKTQGRANFGPYTESVDLKYEDQLFEDMFRRISK